MPGAGGALEAAIAAAGLDVNAWGRVVDALAGHLPGTKVALTTEDLDRRRGVAVAWRGFSAHAMDAYAASRPDFNPWLPVLAGIPTMSPAVSDDFLPFESLAGTPFVTDFIEPEGGAGCWAGIKLYHDAGRISMLTLYYGRAAAAELNAVAPALLHRLAPALAATLDLNRRVFATPGQWHRNAIEVHDYPFFFLNRAGAVWLANSAFDELVARGDVVTCDEDGRMSVRTGPVVGSRLRELLEQRPEGVQAPVEIIEQHPDGSRLAWSLRPCWDGLSPAWLDDARPAVAGRVRLNGVAPAIDAGSLRSTYRLTPAESRLAVFLSTGRSVADAAKEFSIAIGTARNQLKAIYCKVDVHRQSELIALLGEYRA